MECNSLVEFWWRWGVTASLSFWVLCECWYALCKHSELADWHPNLIRAVGRLGVAGFLLAAWSAGRFVGVLEPGRVISW